MQPCRAVALLRRHDYNLKHIVLRHIEAFEEGISCKDLPSAMGGKSLYKFTCFSHFQIVIVKLPNLLFRSLLYQVHNKWKQRKARIERCLITGSFSFQHFGTSFTL